MTELRSILEIAKNHLPAITSIIGSETKYWTKVQKKFGKKMDSAQVDRVTELSIPILLGQAEINNDLAKKFLSFINSTCSNLYSSIPDNLKTKYIINLKTFIQEFDIITPTNPNPCYLNWFAEMLAIQKILADKNYELIDFEAGMENGKSADFLLLDKNESEIYVDVVNIHVKQTSPDLITKELESKFLGKVKNKFKGMSKNGKFILPVLWFEDNILNDLFNSIQILELEKYNVIPPCTLCITPADFSKSYLSTVQSRISN